MASPASSMIGRHRNDAPAALVTPGDPTRRHPLATSNSIRCLRVLLPGVEPYAQGWRLEEEGSVERGDVALARARLLDRLECFPFRYL